MTVIEIDLKKLQRELQKVDNKNLKSASYAVDGFRHLFAFLRELEYLEATFLLERDEIRLLHLAEYLDDVAVGAIDILGEMRRVLLLLRVE